MKAELISIDGQKKGTVELPKQFENEIRLDLIKRACEAEQSTKMAVYGAFPLAGKYTSATKQIKHARAGYKAHYGQGISRVPRKIMSRRGTRFFRVGAFIPGARGGRPAHPPKAFKNFEKMINKKEKIKAFYSAISASKKLIVERKFEELKKANEIKKAINHLVPDKKAVIITSKKIPTKNIDIKIVQLKYLKIRDIAPNGQPIKLTLWTEDAIKELK